MTMIAPTTELTVLYKFRAGHGENIYQCRLTVPAFETSGVNFNDDDAFQGRVLALFVARQMRQAADLYAWDNEQQPDARPLEVHGDEVKGKRIVAVYGQRPKALIERWDNPIVIG